MPNIKISHLEKDKVKILSKFLSKELAEVIKCPLDWITFSYSKSSLFCDGEEVEDTVFVDVEWFDRGEEIRGKVVAILNDAIFKIKSSLKSVNIIFTQLKPECFFENGEHY